MTENFFEHDSKRLGNLTRWKDAGEATRWVITQRGEWNQDYWHLLESLTMSEYWPMSADDIGQVLERTRAEMAKPAPPNPTRPLSPMALSALHQIAGGNQTTLYHLGHFILDPSDGDAGRWHVLRRAERDAWKAVELFLLERLINARFENGDLDAWTSLTPGGRDVRRKIERLYKKLGGTEWTDERKNFDVIAFFELRAARLAGDLQAERDLTWYPGDPVETSLKITENLAATLEQGFPCLAKVIRHPDFCIAGMTWSFLRFRLATEPEIKSEFAWFGDAIFIDHTPSDLTPIAECLVQFPQVVEELIGDVVAQADLMRRARQAGMRKARRSLTPEEDAELERKARAEVQAMLGQSVPIQARTLAEAFAEAERLKASENVLVAQNSLWAWFCALPLEQQAAFGTFEGKYARVRFYAAARLRIQSGQ